MVEEDDYVVLNKPPGVQVTPTVDNLLESCLMLGAKVRAPLPANNSASHPNISTISAFAVISL
jgi:23S rRNA-/tRNA-specific pseudouridylate synthase